MKKPHGNKGKRSPLSGKGDRLAWLNDRIKHEGYECLIWPFTKNWNGYGMLGFHGTVTYAHRVMCRLVHGDPPTPKHVAAHTCHNGSGGCCHPGHVVWKTPRENMMDRHEAGTLTKKRWQSRVTNLTPEQISEIISLKGQKNQREIADMFGISYQHVSAIQNRQLVSQ